jgi:hypothetical protein
MVSDEPSVGAAHDVDFARALLPWWRKPIPVAIMTSIVASVVPTTTAVSAILQKNREVALQELKQRHDSSMEELKAKHAIQMDYMKQMVDEKDRARLLRMVLRTSTDKALAAWATDEMLIVEKSLDAAEKKLAEERKLFQERLEAQSAETVEERHAREASEKKAAILTSALATKAYGLRNAQHQLCVQEAMTCSGERDATLCARDFLACTRSARP